MPAEPSRRLSGPTTPHLCWPACDQRSARGLGDLWGRLHRTQNSLAGPHEALIGAYITTGLLHGSSEECRYHWDHSIIAHAMPKSKSRSSFGNCSPVSCTPPWPIPTIGIWPEEYRWTELRKGARLCENPPERSPCLLEVEWGMAHITGTDRAQVLLLPDTVDG